MKRERGEEHAESQGLGDLGTEPLGCPWVCPRGLELPGTLSPLVAEL